MTEKKNTIGNRISMNKKKSNDRKIIVCEINRAAQLYKKHPVGKKFLYVFDGRYIEVCFKSDSFRHLTGVETNLSAKRFYQYAIKNQLQSSQIYFTSRHPYSLCKKKLKHICEIAVLAGTENFMLEEILTNTKSYKFGTTNLNFTLCLNKEYDKNGQEKSECYIVESLRDEDCFSKSKTAYEVSHIFSKDNSVFKYNNLLFMDKKSDLDMLPDKIASMIEDSLKKKS